jgi:EIN3-binding F-box protein
VNKGIEAEAYEVIAAHFPWLRSLRMNGSYLSDSALARIAKGCPELESIYLKECEVRLSRGLKALAENCLRLNDIHLSRTTSLGNTALHTLITAKAKTLRKLRLFMADTLQPGVITAISTLCTNLVHLDMCDCDFAVHSDAFMCSISATCRGLQSLNLSPCTDVTDIGVSAVAQHCTLLCSLRISACPGLTNTGLEAVAIYSTSLQRLELSHCKSVSDEGIAAIAQHRGAVFKALILERLNGCTDSLLRTVVNSCPHLSYLRVYWCPNITPAGLALLAFPGSRVREIRYWSNQSCSVGTMVDVLTVIAERCRYLRVLALDGRFLSPPEFPKHLFPGCA